MNHKILKFAGALLTTAGLVATTPVIAQSSGGGGGGGGSGSAGGQAYSTETRQDNDRNWSWIGLLGLLGLMGMRRKPNDDNNYRDNNVNRRPV
jgi:hypothetical protein